MSADPLQYASIELREAVEEMGREALLAAIDELVQDNEEWTLEWFDAENADLVADEILEWTIASLARTGPLVAHAALDVVLATYPVEEDDEDEPVSAATGITAFVRVAFGPQIRGDRYELDFADLGEWIVHDAVRIVDEPTAVPARSIRGAPEIGGRYLTNTLIPQEHDRSIARDVLVEILANHRSGGSDVRVVETGQEFFCPWGNLVRELD